MTRLTMAVPLHPRRYPPRAGWLKDVHGCNVETVMPDLGPPIPNYTTAHIYKAIYEEIRKVWKESDSKFFGVCYDDVVLKHPLDVELMLDMLDFTDITLIGLFARETRWPYRLWIAPSHCLLDVSWEELWRRYHKPDIELAWFEYCKLKPARIMTEYSHLLPKSGDASKPGCWFVEHYNGADSQIGDFEIVEPSA